MGRDSSKLVTKELATCSLLAVKLRLEDYKGRKLVVIMMGPPDRLAQNTPSPRLDSVHRAGKEYASKFISKNKIHVNPNSNNNRKLHSSESLGS
jgi:hypothetical protein